MNRSRSISASPSRSSTQRSRSSLRIARAYSGHSTLPWWLVVAATAWNCGSRPGPTYAVRNSPDRSSSVRFCGAWTGIARQHLARLGDGVAGLEHVAHDERDREAVADVAAAAERQ